MKFKRDAVRTRETQISTSWREPIIGDGGRTGGGGGRRDGDNGVSREREKEEDGKTKREGTRDRQWGSEKA